MTPQARRTTGIVARQLAAMGSDSFAIGLREEATGRMLPARIWTLAEITDPRIIAWLMYMNTGSRPLQPPSPWHVYIQPAGEERNLTLIDDIDATAVAAMRTGGFEPALLVETSPGNFQAWLKHDRWLTPPIASLLARKLATRFGGDLSSAASSHYGRLASFTNPKPPYRDARGRFPFVRLVEARGHAYSMASRYIDQILASIPPSAPTLTVPCASSRSHPGVLPPQGQIPTIGSFHRNPRYAGDLHRADMAFAAYAATHGAPPDWVERQILSARDLSKKGHPARQLAYAHRTAAKATVQVQSFSKSRSDS